jgi:hypothetical protein
MSRVRSVFVVIFAMLLFGLVTPTSAQDTAAAPAGVAGQAPAGPNRPATVPADYVITPFGYFHPSCVLQIPNGSTVLKEEAVIRHADGTYGNVQPCAYPQYTAKGENVTGGQSPAQQPSIAHASPEWASTCMSFNGAPGNINCNTEAPAYGQMQGYLTVPEGPATTAPGEVLFFWFGMEDWQVANDVIQPVLGWNRDFPKAWSIASWNCCLAGITWEAEPVKVNVGDKIIASITSPCAPGQLTCPEWDIDAYDQTLNAHSELLLTSSFGETFNWAMVVMEVYNVSTCKNYPRGNVTFDNLTLEDYNFNNLNPAWTLVQNGTYGVTELTPQCGYNVSVAQTLPNSPYTSTGMQVSLKYVP